MKIRNILFWVHFVAGSVAGLIILIMCITGLLLAYERQITAWADHARVAMPANGVAKPLPMYTLIARVAAKVSGQPTALTVRSRFDKVAEVAYGRERVVFVDRATGAVVSEGSRGVRRFFRVTQDWHRWLAMGGNRRSFGRAITGASNLAFLLLVCSGLIIWWPRGLSWERFRSALRLQWRVRRRARERNWHTVLGFWAGLPLFFIVISAVVMSYPWANTLLFRMTGNEAPATRRPGATAAATESPIPASVSNAEFARLDELWARAQRQVPGWKSITARLPIDARTPVAFTINRGNGGRPDLRSQLTVDWETGEVLRWQRFADNNSGQRLRMWLRWVHTGEAGDWLGQTLGALACAAGMVLVYTGTALAWRRIGKWRRKPPPARDQKQPQHQPRLETPAEPDTADSVLTLR